MQAGEDGCISVYTSPSTVLTAVVNEAVYNAIFQEYAKTMLADFITSYDVVSVKTVDELNALIDEHYMNMKRKIHQSFICVYEDIQKTSMTIRHYFKFSSRTCRIFIMLTALAGGSSSPRRKKKGRFLLRRPDEKWFVPFLYSYLPALFLSVFGLLALIIGSVAPINVTLIAELALLIVFSALCSILCTLLTADHKIIARL